MQTLSKLSSQFRKLTAAFFSLILPVIIKFIVLVILVSWVSYKRARFKYKYTAEINKKSSKFVFGSKFKPVSQELLSCSICLSEYAEGEQVREIQCKHIFHRSCLEKWLQESRATCPICRFLVLPKETVEEYKQAQNEHADSGFEEEMALFLLSATQCRRCNGF